MNDQEREARLKAIGENAARLWQILDHNPDAEDEMTGYRVEPYGGGPYRDESYGPWLAEWRVVDSDGRVVAWECRRDDARLFAAAPELLAALKLAWEYEQTAVDLPVTVYSAIKSAIKKAEGRDA